MQIFDFYPLSFIVELIIYLNGKISMLSYRHGFHAGNHADVLKHWACVLMAEYMGQKGKPFWYIDTHSGAGVYSLDSEESKKTGEHNGGISAIWGQKVPAIFDSYIGLIKTLNQGDQLKLYPGSPWFVGQCLEKGDRARLFELHPQDFKLLNRNFGGDRSIKTEQLDGFSGLKSILPPPTKRALVVIDPPYEQAKEYDMVVDNVQQSLKKFATGVYAVWYPLINRNTKQNASEKMVGKLREMAPKSSLEVSFCVNGKGEDAGMYGSGLFIINPPWNLEKQLNEGLPFLLEKLGKTNQAGFNVKYTEL
ncbi:MAG: 23S rRNA (adenine2030-N6)-methyltransferase [Bermanella sp.]|jgi:23S rRNA (adenine2030-N6)-methyltransferase